MWRTSLTVGVSRLWWALFVVWGATACGTEERRDPAVELGLSFGDGGVGDSTSGTSAAADDNDVPSPGSGGAPGSSDGDPVDDGSDESGAAEAGYPDIARVQVPDGWATGPGNRWTYPFDTEAPPDYEIGVAFYADHADDYDFLAVYTEGEFQEFGAHAISVREDVRGIRPGDETPWSAADLAGSAGRLQQINLMNTPQDYAFDPSATDILIHETIHRWAAFIDLLGAPSAGYLWGINPGHWNVHVHTGGASATGYGDLMDLGGGYFRFEVTYPLQVSPLELYLAGFIPPEELPPLFYVANATGYEPAVDPWGDPIGLSTYGEDVAFSGTRVDFDIGDIVAANGPREPAFGEAPTHFRVAFILVCTDVTNCRDADLAIVEAQRAAFPAEFAAATGNRASVDTTL